MKAISSCPYCASSHLHLAHHLFSYNVECCTCKAAGPRKKSEQEATLAWNQLVVELELAREIERNNLLTRMTQIEHAVQQLEVELHS